MANEKNEQKKTDAAPTPPVNAPAPAPAPAAAPGALEAARAKLKALQETNELAQVQAEIDKLENGGRGPLQVKARRAAEEKREKTLKEGELALYRLTEPAYKPLKPGGEVSIRAAGTIIRIPVSRLPGASMEAVKRAAPAQSDEFAPA